MPDGCFIALLYPRVAMPHGTSRLYNSVLVYTTSGLSPQWCIYCRDLHLIVAEWGVAIDDTHRIYTFPWQLLKYPKMLFCSMPIRTPTLNVKCNHRLMHILWEIDSFLLSRESPFIPNVLTSASTFKRILSPILKSFEQ